MKTKDNFKDLAEANEYIAAMNTAFTTEVIDKRAANDKLKLTEENLSKVQSDLANSEGKRLTAETDLQTANGKVETYKGSETKVKELVTSLNEATEIITELGTKIALLEKTRGEKSLFVSVGGKSYKLLGNRFITKNGELDAEALSKDTAELERMVRIGSGSLVPAE